MSVYDSCSVCVANTTVSFVVCWDGDTDLLGKNLIIWPTCGSETSGTAAFCTVAVWVSHTCLVWWHLSGAGDAAVASASVLVNWVIPYGSSNFRSHTHISSSVLWSGSKCSVLEENLSAASILTVSRARITESICSVCWATDHSIINVILAKGSSS